MSSPIINTVPNSNECQISQNNYEPNLVRGDWFKICDIIRKESIDLILTDLPYGILESQNWDKEIDIKKLEKTIDFVLKPNGLFITFCNQSLLIRLLSVFTLFKQRSLHIWHKSSPMPINDYMPLPDFEFILVFKKIEAKTSDLAWCPKRLVEGGLPYTIKSNILDSPTRRHKKSKILVNGDGKRWIRSVLEAPNKPNMRKSERTSHPTQKPEILLRELIKVYSKQGQIVLDPFAGSFSTIISAYKENRKSIGVELETKYFNESQKRINEIISQQELF